MRQSRQTQRYRCGRADTGEGPGPSSGRPAETGKQQSGGSACPGGRRRRGDRARAAVSPLDAANRSRRTRRDLRPRCSSSARMARARSRAWMRWSANSWSGCTRCRGSRRTTGGRSASIAPSDFDGAHRRGRGRGPGGRGLGTEHVALEAVTHLGDRGSGQQRRRATDRRRPDGSPGRGLTSPRPGSAACHWWPPICRTRASNSATARPNIAGISICPPCAGTFATYLRYKTMRWWHRYR